ncbi:putative E3 ubiquitin-protein ligase dma1 [Smittium mucronatum]|uniref:Putative E3 ubiquitin-protein ligase dma1 n=1 Tax=Smittium mucronatum TaxID=133383 RepID=A0A1R0H6L4_9FUNG|nr:putative E3 ubiquitin-protein ligase dma1 [Smittium mucronatum]
MEPSETSSETPADSQTSIPHIRIVPHIVDVRHCLYFDVIDRDVPESLVLKVGRFTEKFSHQLSRVAFKSKVVSRSHAEIWSENGEFFLRDTKSSSGTFLNHMRLAPPGVESRPYPLKDGDILHTGFSCPLCRTYADLEASVTVDENEREGMSLAQAHLPEIGDIIQNNENLPENNPSTGIEVEQATSNNGDESEQMMIEVENPASDLVDEEPIQNIIELDLAESRTRSQNEDHDIMQVPNERIVTTDTGVDVDMNVEPELSNDVNEGVLDDDRMDFNTTPVQTLNINLDPDRSHVSTPIETEVIESFNQNQQNINSTIS